MSSNTHNPNAEPRDGGGFGSAHNSDLFISPDLLREVRDGVRAIARARLGREIEVSDTDIQNIIGRELNALGQEGLSTYLGNLRTLHDTEITENLEEAISSTQATINATPSHHLFRAAHHNSLGILLRWKFDKTASLDDIDEAI
jgi:hypothetical protein